MPVRTIREQHLTGPADLILGKKDAKPIITQFLPGSKNRLLELAFPAAINYFKKNI